MDRFDSSGSGFNSSSSRDNPPPAPPSPSSATSPSRGVPVKLSTRCQLLPVEDVLRAPSRVKITDLFTDNKIHGSSSGQEFFGTTGTTYHALPPVGGSRRDLGNAASTSRSSKRPPSSRPWRTAPRERRLKHLRARAAHTRPRLLPRRPELRARPASPHGSAAGFPCRRPAPASPLPSPGTTHRPPGRSDRPDRPAGAQTDQPAPVPWPWRSAVAMVAPTPLPPRLVHLSHRPPPPWIWVTIRGPGSFMPLHARAVRSLPGHHGAASSPHQALYAAQSTPAYAASGRDPWDRALTALQSAPCWAYGGGGGWFMDIGASAHMAAHPDVATTLTAFFAFVSTQFGRPIHALQTDNGKEFDNITIRSLLATHGAIFRLTCPYTSSQNGRAERMLRTLNDCVRTLLFHASMPPRFWPDALATATLLVNIRPCRVRWSYTPHHLLYGAPPTYDDLRIFGCRCYPNTAATAASGLMATPPTTPPASLLAVLDRRDGPQRRPFFPPRVTAAATVAAARLLPPPRSIALASLPDGRPTVAIRVALPRPLAPPPPPPRPRAPPSTRRARSFPPDESVPASPPRPRLPPVGSRSAVRAYERAWCAATIYGYPRIMRRAASSV
ncbi:hypothetical protein QYE76_036349 [Lolium multiflorum]|uniref:Integrase catalytic domain-containing protein n=1 Tax=Lolium multiflorum TaxID=4521 RepID=A0AAD8R1J9_LOLMU|nr:hypothetical protein QYE76_036349 [Lolium multiflorum]